MKAVRIPFFILLGVLVFTCFVKPSVNYDKVEYYAYESKSNFTLEDSEENEEEVPNLVTLEIILDYDDFGVDQMEFDERHTRDQIKEHQKERKNKAKKYHYNNNDRIAKMFNLKNYQELYVSSYFPVIEVTYNLEYFKKHEEKILSRITNNVFVKRLKVIELCLKTDYVLEAVIASDAYDVYTDRTTTGDGVVVGVLESGVVDDDHMNLVNTSVTTRFSIYNALQSKEHPTCMASLIAGTTGIAPGASILSCFWNGSMADEAEWLMDHDVDIINMSCGEDSNGVYGGDSIYVDYVICTYNIICVVSAGNDGNTHGYVANPGLSYNAITVGSMAKEGYAYGYSSYITLDGPEKPTISTDGTLYWDLEDGSTLLVTGTSAAAALISGFTALLLEDYPSLVTNHAQLRALITANAERFESYYVFPTDCGFDDRGGAGLFNYQNVIDNMTNSSAFYLTPDMEGPRFYNQRIYLRKGQTVRFSVAWTAISNGEDAQVYMTDYDAMIRNSNDEVVECANSIDSCVEVLSFTAGSSGYYTLYVYRAGEMDYPVDKVGVAYRIIS